MMGEARSPGMAIPGGGNGKREESSSASFSRSSKRGEVERTVSDLLDERSSGSESGRSDVLSTVEPEDGL